MPNPKKSRKAARKIIMRRHEPDPLGPVLTMRDALADLRGKPRPDNPTRRNDHAQ